MKDAIGRKNQNLLAAEEVFVRDPNPAEFTERHQFSGHEIGLGTLKIQGGIVNEEREEKDLRESESPEKSDKDRMPCGCPMQEYSDCRCPHEAYGWGV